MANNAQANWIKDTFNGRGWENSIEITSFEELRSKLIDLGASIYFDESFGITNANVHVDGKFIIAETTIDSYRSYLISGQNHSSFSNFNGNYNDLTAEESYGGSPLSFNLSSTNNPLDNLRNALEPGQKGYLVFDVNSTNVELDNGFTLNSSPTGSPSTANPELVLELNDEFWLDYKNIFDVNSVNAQKNVGMTFNLKLKV